MARYRLNRTITVSGFVAEADPRVTPPADSLLFEVQRDFEGGRTAGHSLFFRALTSGGADVTSGVTVTFIPWIKDEDSGAFVKLSASRTVEVSRAIQSDDVGLIYVQVTAINSPGTAATLQIRAADRQNVVLVSA